MGKLVGVVAKRPQTPITSTSWFVQQKPYGLLGGHSAVRGGGLLVTFPRSQIVPTWLLSAIYRLLPRDNLQSVQKETCKG